MGDEIKSVLQRGFSLTLTILSQSILYMCLTTRLLTWRESYPISLFTTDFNSLKASGLQEKAILTIELRAVIRTPLGWCFASG